jgi:PadR family transcriptional regulator PadR
VFDKSQLMRGTLEGCILKIISKKTTYGYEILEYLKTNGFDDIAEGTIYPLLLRLEKQGSITAQLQPSPLGPKRKYFTITPVGRADLESFQQYWWNLSGAVNRLEKRVGDEDA